MYDDQQPENLQDEVTGYIPPYIQEEFGNVRGWMRRHKDDLLIASVLILGYKHRRLRKHVKKLTGVSLEHAKVTKQIAETGKSLAQLVSEDGMAIEELFRRSEILHDSAKQHRNAINELGKRSQPIFDAFFGPNSQFTKNLSK